jgi:hypothetical protein
VKNHLKRDQKNRFKPQEKKQFWREKKQTNKQKLEKNSKRKEKTLLKSCVSAAPRAFVKPLVQELYWEKENVKNHTFLLPVRLKLELIFTNKENTDNFKLKIEQKKNCEKGLFKVQTWLKINNPKLCFTTSRLASSTPGACFTT